MSGITSEEFRQVLGSFATGVTVVTTRGGDHCYGMTANAFASVSLDPPLVLVCGRRASDGGGYIARNGVFAVNILAAHQESLSRYFASENRRRGRDAFRDVPHHFAASGAPILDGSVAFLDCSLHETYDAGDHRIFIGRVLDSRLDPTAEPLLFHHGAYRRFDTVQAGD